MSVPPAPSDPRSALGPDVPSRALHVRADRPVDVLFSFEQRQSRVGVAASVAAHVAMVVLAVLVMRYQPAAEPITEEPPDETPDLIWIAEPGPGGGGGGGGNRAPDPPRKVELPGEAKLTVPVQRPPEIAKPDPPKEDPPPQQDLNIPAKPLASAEQTLPGVLESANVAQEVTESQGSGSGGGGGTGTGTGIGSGQGSGLGEGSGGGTGGGAYRPGSGVSQPRLLREKKPQYTADAMRAKVQGVVVLECIVLADGSVGDVRVVKSLDPVFGLDQQAIAAAREWKFSPGMRLGEPVPTIITIELTFNLR